MARKTTYNKSPVTGFHSTDHEWSLNANEGGEWITDTCGTMSVQVDGEFGGAKCYLEGKNHPEADGVKLQQQFDDDLTFGVPGFSGVRDIPKYIRPVVEGGDGSTKINIYIHMVP